MSNSNINNGKRHVRDRAFYGGAPNQKKRIRHPALEDKKYHFKYNIESIITIILIHLASLRDRNKVSLK